MRIAFGSDHAGYELKRTLMDYLAASGHECFDLGADTAETASSYVPYSLKVAEGVAGGLYDRGVLICGTGLGISMTANKVRGIRAAVCTNEFMARMARQHNDANILALGARVIGRGLALGIADTFFCTEFETGGRHQDRVDEILAAEARHMK